MCYNSLNDFIGETVLVRLSEGKTYEGKISRLVDDYGMSLYAIDYDYRGKYTVRETFTCYDVVSIKESI